MKELLKTKEAAEYLGYSPQRIRESRMKGGTLGGLTPPPHVKIGRGVRYRISELKKWADALPEG